MNPLLAFFRPNTWRVFRRNLLAWQKYAWSSVAINVLEPFGYFLAIGFGLGAYVVLGRHGSLAQFVAPGLLGMLAMNTATFDSCWGCFERLRFNGVYESMVTAPVDPLEIAAGEFVWEAFRATMYGTLFFAVVVGFGLVHSWWALLVPLVLGLTGLLFAIPGFTVAMLVKSQEQLFYYFSMIIGPMVLIAGVFFPLDRLPKWAYDIAWATPLFHAVNVCRALVLGQLSPSVLGDLAWLLVAIVLLVFVPVRIVRAKLGN